MQYLTKPFDYPFRDKKFIYSVNIGYIQHIRPILAYSGASGAFYVGRVG